MEQTLNKTMKPTAAILENIRQASKANKEVKFTRLFRYMLRPDIYYLAYEHLYANNGAATKGVNNDTADGFSQKKVMAIIQSLKDGTYTPSPVRRTYIPKRNGKLRPLGIPTFTDKLVQEVLRMILEAVYEPIFLPSSHGFRPNRSCHTALKDIKHGYPGVRWFVEGDIKGFFDHIDHGQLTALVYEKVKDARIIQLLHKMLKAGYLEDWKYNRTLSGTPQGGIISPLLANIYLHELDKFMADMKAGFDKPKDRVFTPEYMHFAGRVHHISKLLKKETDPSRIAALRREQKEKRAQMMKLPAKSQTDKRINYVRYADDFLVGVVGSKEDCENIKAKIRAFLAERLKLELSDEKTLITHSAEYARFLGYDVRVRRNGQIKNGGQGYSQRTLSNKVELNVPLTDKIEKYLFNRKAVMWADGALRPVHRGALVTMTDLEILMVYNAELRGICNYYGIASNFAKLGYFAYLMEYSCLMTLASKHKSSVSKMLKQFKDGKGGWCIPYETRKGKKYMYFAKYQDCKAPKDVKDAIPHAVPQTIKMTLGSVADTVGASMISARQLPSGVISGSKLALGSVGIGQLQEGAVGELQIQEAAIGNAHIQNAAISAANIQSAAIEFAHIAAATINSLNAGAIEATTAKIASLRAADIQTDSLAAALAAFTVITCGTATFDAATIKHLVAQSMNLDYGAAGQVFIIERL